MARVRVYGNTGFNGVDIPDDMSILTHGDHEIMEYEDMNIQSCEGLTSIIVEISTSDALTVDYFWIRDNDNNDCLYINMGSRPVANGTYEFALEPNALSTILEDITIISAVAERMSVADDDDTFYPNPEPFEISEPIKNSYGPFDARFPDEGNANVVTILETITQPSQRVSLSSSQTIQGTNKVVQQVYGPTQQFVATEGPVQDYTTGQAITILDANDNILSQSVLSTMQPKLRPIVNTGLVINKLFEGSVSVNTGTNLWITGIAEVINHLTADGADRMILNYWSVPAPYIQSVVDVGYTPNGASGGGVSSITNSVYNNTFNWTMQAGYHNNKLYYGQAITLTVFNPISGARLTKECWQIRDENITPGEGTTIPCSYSIAADIRPDGAPIFAWKNENGLPYHGFPETIEGGGWQRIPIAANTYSGSEWDRRALANQKSILNDPLMKNTAEGLNYATNGAAQSGSNALNNWADEWWNSGDFFKAFAAAPIIGIRNLGNAVGQIPSGAVGALRESILGGNIGVGGMQGLNWTQANRALQLQEQELRARASIAQPVLSISTSNFLRETGYNAFYAIVSSYSDTDLRAFDTFLTKYGYNVGNKKFEETDFWSRPHFNYVKLKSIIMKSERSIWMRQVAEQQLMRGVRIWHEYPSRGAIENGNK